MKNLSRGSERVLFDFVDAPVLLWRHCAASAVRPRIYSGAITRGVKRHKGAAPQRKTCVFRHSPLVCVSYCAATAISPVSADLPKHLLQQFWVVGGDEVNAVVDAPLQVFALIHRPDVHF